MRITAHLSYRRIRRYSVWRLKRLEARDFSKELFHMTDNYVIDIQDPGNALDALMFVLAIEAEKCSRN